MAVIKLYKDYFNIRPTYHSVVTKELVDRGEVKWQDFYPHESFIELLKNVVKLISGTADGSLWLEGSYGTGKTHAILTVKALLEASETEVKDYFKEYHLKDDLCQNLIAAKNAGRILVVHRKGSSDIESDKNLTLAVQESIEYALKKAGLKNKAVLSCKNAAIKWFKAKEANRKCLNIWFKEPEYFTRFKGKSTDEVFKCLEENDDPEIVLPIMYKLYDLAEVSQLDFIRLDKEDLCKWITEVMQVNHISSILFIWDEFTDFLHRHSNSLSGFQTLVELGTKADDTKGFHFLIVTHERVSLNTTEQGKILDRFVGNAPIYLDLPDNISFRLMAHAMKETSDPTLQKEWEEKVKAGLNNDLRDARKWLIDEAKKAPTTGKTLTKAPIENKDLCDIVPIHPYAALVLKHMSGAFKSNARSMFDFIIEGDSDVKGFKWFIAERHPIPRDEGILTIDMLWDFFTKQKKSGLSDNVRIIFDSLSRLKNGVLENDDEVRVFKTVALLEAISRVSEVAMLRPTPDNINMAFVGVWGENKTKNIVKRLYNKGILFKRMGTDEYTVARTGADTKTIDDLKAKIRRELDETQDLIKDANLLPSNDKTDSIPAINLPAWMLKRFEIKGTGAKKFKDTNDKFKGDPVSNKFKMLVAFALDEDEGAKIRAELLEAAKDCPEDFIYVESCTPMGKTLLDNYVENMAYCKHYLSSDRDQSDGCGKMADKALEKWKENVAHADGGFRLYTSEYKSGKYMSNLDALIKELRNIDYKKYPYGLEHFSDLTVVMSQKNRTESGAKCGIKQKLEGEYRPARTNNMRLDKELEGAWNVENYWEDSTKENLPIVKIKKKVIEVIDEGFNSKSAVSFLSIFKELEKPPFGFMPNNISAFVLGFVLKEYASDEFLWTVTMKTEKTKTEKMSPEKLAKAISHAIDNAVKPGTNNEEYIRKISEEEEIFLKFTVSVFGLPVEDSNSVENARTALRKTIRDWAFPIWFIRFALDEGQQLKSSIKDVTDLIDRYCDLLNIDNSENKLQETQVAEEIGELVKSVPSLQADSAKLLKSDNCRSGMISYVGQYREGRLAKLAAEINNGGKYIDAIKERFSAEANWTWDKDTINKQIDDVILEYEIIAESNKSPWIRKCTSLSDVVDAWKSCLNNVHMPYSEIKKRVAGGSLKGLLEQFYSLNQSTDIKDKNIFFKELSSHRPEFENFYANQLPVFKEVCGSFLKGMDNSDISQLMENLPQGQFFKGDLEYFNNIKSAVIKFKSESKKAQLKKLWSDKTGTKDPVDWSERYTTPVLCMFEADELKTAKHMINLLINGSSVDREMEEALKYFNETFPWDRLKDSAARDKCFTERIVGDYAVLLPDAETIRKALRENVNDQVYYWTDDDDKSVEDCLKNLATNAYKTGGIKEVRSVIALMSDAQLRDFVDELTSDNLTVAIEILKTKRGTSNGMH